MKNLAFVAGDVRCAITRKACVNGVKSLGSGYIRANSHCTAGFLGVEADFERLKYGVSSAISRSNHNRSCGTCNMPLTTRRDKAQCNVKRHMATNTINLLDEGGMQGCNYKCKGTESIQNLSPLLPLLWFNAFSLGNQIHNSQLLLVCHNSVWLVTHWVKGPATHWVKLKAKVFASWGTPQQAENLMGIAQIIYLCHDQGWCERQGARQGALCPRPNQLFSALCTST